MTKGIIVSEADLNFDKKALFVEEDASMSPLIVTEEDRLNKKDIEVSSWKDASSLLIYLKKALSAVPSVVEGSHNAVKRAIAYYDGLLGEIEEAVEKDANYAELNNAQIAELDTIDNTIVTARNQLIDSLEKTAENVKRQGLVKEATTPNNLVYTVDPFLKAISYICINAKISNGKNIEEVFEELVTEYDIDKRERLAVLQILKDSGYPVRHSMMDTSNDMIKQYYA